MLAEVYKQKTFTLNNSNIRDLSVPYCVRLMLYIGYTDDIAYDTICNLLSPPESQHARDIELYCAFIFHRFGYTNVCIRMFQSNNMPHEKYVNSPAYHQWSHINRSHFRLNNYIKISNWHCPCEACNPPQPARFMFIDADTVDCLDMTPDFSHSTYFRLQTQHSLCLA
jgi:hypothetical protein